MKTLLARVLPLLVAFLALGGSAFDLFPDSAIPHAGRVSLTILIIGAILWISEAVPLFVTSLVILLLSTSWLSRVLEQAGTPVVAGTFTAPFFSDIILLFLGGFVISAALNKFQLDLRMARAVIRRTGHSMPLLIMGIMGITAFLSMWLSNTATAAMMITLCLPIVARIPPGDRTRVANLLAVPFAANIGGMGTPIGSPPNAIAMEYLRGLGNAPSFLTWMSIGVPLAIVMLLAAWGLLLTMFRGETKSVELDPTHDTTEPLSARSWVVIVITLVTVGGWLTGRQHGLSVGTVALLPVITFFGTGILTIKDLRSLAWDVLLVMGGGLCLGKGIAVSGLADWFVAQLPGGDQPLIVLATAVCLLACGMSTVMSNTATANLIMPIVLGIGSAAVSPLLTAVALACTLAMALPISTPPNAIAFSSGDLTVANLMKPGIVLSVLGLVLLLIVGLWWMGVVGI